VLFLLPSYNGKVRRLGKINDLCSYVISKKPYLYRIIICMTTHTDLLQLPIASLPLSGDLKTLLSSKGYANLQTLLQQKLSHLRTKDGLTFRQELELFDLVNGNGLGRMWNEG